jgi:hypothetical protein
MFQNAGEKGTEHFEPADPPRSRANKRRGRGTFANYPANDLRAHVEQFTGPGMHISTDEYESYATIERPHTTVCHAAREWARDADEDGTREAHTNTCEGMWAALRTYLRYFVACINGT